MSTHDESGAPEQLEQLVESGGAAALGDFLETLSPGETARVVSRLDDEAQVRLLTTLPPEDAADLVEELAEAQATGLIESLEPVPAAAICNELESGERADLLRTLDASDAEAILARMRAAEAADARRLLGYPDDVAGGLMITEYLAFDAAMTAAAVVEDLRRHADRYRDYDVQYTYVTGADGRLAGVLRLRDLLLAAGDRRLEDLMYLEPVSVSDRTPLDTLNEFFGRHSLLGAPVVDDDGRLLGVVRRASVQEAMSDRADSDYRKSQGLVQEELRTMPLLLRSRRRLMWLSLNIVLNVIAASVIALHEDTLSAVIALAVFLPIISDMSGCSGNQAVAVSMRELSLGLVRPDEIAWVWAKEALVGVLNGLVLGVLLGAAAWLWKGNPYLGLVVGTALAINTIVAVSIGGTVPLVLKRFGLDPALASGPILTTLTDLCGFLLVLSFAAAMMSRLVAT